MQIDAFVFWQAVESEQGQIDRKKNWGLLHGQFEGNSEEYFVTKKYHVMRQYSAFIRPGDVMIGSDDQDSVAFMNAAEGKLVIVKRNASTMESTVNFDLTAFARLQLSGVRRTMGGQAGSENFEELDLIPITQGQLVATIAPQSVTTFVFDCVVAD
jgi:O-glycosyl hydrolase